MKTIAHIAKTLGATEGQVRAQFARNAVQLAAMAAQAEKTGRKVNGYDAAQLRAMAGRSREKYLR